MVHFCSTYKNYKVHNYRLKPLQKNKINLGIISDRHMTGEIPWYSGNKNNRFGNYICNYKTLLCLMYKLQVPMNYDMRI